MVLPRILSLNYAPPNIYNVVTAEFQSDSRLCKPVAVCDCVPFFLFLFPPFSCLEPVAGQGYYVQKNASGVTDEFSRHLVANGGVCRKIPFFTLKEGSHHVGFYYPPIKPILNGFAKADLASSFLIDSYHSPLCI